MPSLVLRATLIVWSNVHVFTLQVTVQNTATLELGFRGVVMHHVRTVQKVAMHQMRLLSVSHVGLERMGKELHN